jgi:hypothetical protein
VTSAAETDVRVPSTEQLAVVQVVTEEPEKERCVAVQAVVAGTLRSQIEKSAEDTAAFLGGTQTLLLELPIAMRPDYADHVPRGYVVLGAAANDPRTSMWQVPVPEELGSAPSAETRGPIATAMAGMVKSSRRSLLVLKLQQASYHWAAVCSAQIAAVLVVPEVLEPLALTGEPGTLMGPTMAVMGSRTELCQVPVAMKTHWVSQQQVVVLAAVLAEVLDRSTASCRNFGQKQSLVLGTLSTELVLLAEAGSTAPGRMGVQDLRTAACWDQSKLELD